MDAPPPPPPSPAAAEVLSSPDLLVLITARVGAGDLLCWALGCRAFRAAQIEARPGPGGRITTPIEGFVGSSEERCAWVRGLGAALVPRREDQTAFCEVAAARACRSGDLACIRALREGGGGGVGAAAFWWGDGSRGHDEWDRRVPMDYMCDLVARRGRLEVLQWARGQGCPWDWRTCSWAAKGGHLSTLQFLREHGCPWDEATCSRAAEGGHLSTLQWAHEHGCPWDAATCIFASEGGHLPTLQWAHEHGCPWDAVVVRHFARDHPGVLRWLDEIEQHE